MPCLRDVEKNDVACCGTPQTYASACARMMRLPPAPCPQAQPLPLPLPAAPTSPFSQALPGQPQPRMRDENGQDAGGGGGDDGPQVAPRALVFPPDDPFKALLRHMAEARAQHTEHIAMLEQERDDALEELAAAEEGARAMQIAHEAALAEAVAAGVAERDEALHRVAELQAARDEALQQLQSVRTELETARATHAALEQEREDLRTLLTSAEHYVKQAKDARMAAEEARTAADERATGAEAELAELATRLNALQARNQKLTAAFISRMDELRALRAQAKAQAQAEAEAEAEAPPPSPPRPRSPSPPPPPPPSPPAIDENNFFEAPAGLEAEAEEEEAEEEAAAVVCDWRVKHGHKANAKPCAGPLAEHVRRDHSVVTLCAAHTCITLERAGCRIMTRAPQGRKCPACSSTTPGKRAIKRRDRERQRLRRGDHNSEEELD